MRQQENSHEVNDTASERLLGEYVVVRELSANSIYRWVEATSEHKKGESCVLQLLQASVPVVRRRPVKSYFELLRGPSLRPALALPEEVMSDSVTPLAMRYSGELASGTADPGAVRNLIKDDLTTLRKWSRALSDALHEIHRRDAVHGCIHPGSICIVNGRPVLTGLGYAPFLQAKVEEAMTLMDAYLAPEVRAKEEFTLAADIYGFGQVVASWHPPLSRTAWFARAINASPASRFATAREAYDALTTTLEEIESAAIVTSSTEEETDVQSETGADDETPPVVNAGSVGTGGVPIVPEDENGEIISPDSPERPEERRPDTDGDTIPNVSALPHVPSRISKGGDFLRGDKAPLNIVLLLGSAALVIGTLVYSATQWVVPLLKQSH
jgi:hypothetical protein